MSHPSSRTGSNHMTSRSRGDATRVALIHAAVDIFGRDGFHAASTRAIASAARVNQALIGFHFGGKQGLYMAAVGHVVSRIGERIGPLMQAIAEELAPAEPASSPSARKRHEALLYRTTDTLVAMFTAEESRAWARLILREQQDPSDAFEVIYQGTLGGAAAVLTELVARVLNRSSADRGVRLMVLTILGQALIFRTASAAVMRHLGVRRLAATDVSAIQAQVRRNVAAMLKAGVADE